MPRTPASACAASVCAAPAASARAARGPASTRPTTAARAWRPYLRYLQIIPVGLVLWGLDVADRFRAGAAAAGLAHAVVVNAISWQLGGGFAGPLNGWLAIHELAATTAAWYYVVAQGAVTGAIGLLLLWRRSPAFGLHRNALVACNVIGLVAFWLYPVAPPRMLAGYHDVTAAAVPLFASVVEGKAAGQFASLPSLHVTWALWVAVAAGSLVRRPALRAAVWSYPALTALDVLGTANHYWLDVITAPGVLVLAYGIAASLALARRRRRRAQLVVVGCGADQPPGTAVHPGHDDDRGPRATQPEALADPEHIAG